MHAASAIHSSFPKQTIPFTMIFLKNTFLSSFAVLTLLERLVHAEWMCTGTPCIGHDSETSCDCVSGSARNCLWDYANRVCVAKSTTPQCSSQTGLLSCRCLGCTWESVNTDPEGSTDDSVENNVPNSYESEESEKYYESSNELQSEDDSDDPNYVISYNEDDSGGLSGGAIAGIIIFVVLFIVGAGALVIWLVQRRNCQGGSKRGSKVLALGKEEPKPFPNEQDHGPPKSQDRTYSNNAQMMSFEVQRRAQQEMPMVIDI